jgi:hypothetical protein
MKRLSSLSQVVLLVVCSALFAFSQSTASKDSNNIVPRLVRFGGTLTDANGKPLTSIAGVTFSLYKDSDGGSPLWAETQNVQPDSKGHYTVLLGSTRSEGMSSALFASGDARWLGVQPQAQPEQPRVLMVSVPYALKAIDAETLGGKPASAYLTAETLAAGSSAYSHSTSQTSPVSANPVAGLKFGSPGTLPPNCPILGAGTNTFIPLWTGGCAIGNSIMRQFAGKVSVAGPLGLFFAGVQGPNSYPLSFGASAGTFGLQGQSTFGPHGHFNVLWNGVATGFYARDDGGMAANFGTFKDANPNPNAYGISATSVDPNAVSYGVYGLDQTPSAIGLNSGGIGVWGDSSQQIGVQGTSDTNSAIYGENNTGGSGFAAGWFVNDSTTVGDLVVEADGGNGSCLIDVNGDLMCDGAVQANHLTTGQGTNNTDLAGSCPIVAGGACYTFTNTTYATPPICVATDTSGVNPVQVVATNAALAVFGTVGDTANYICIQRDVPPPVKRGHGHGSGNPAVRAGSPVHDQQ